MLTNKGFIGAVKMDGKVSLSHTSHEKHVSSHLMPALAAASVGGKINGVGIEAS